MLSGLEVGMFASTPSGIVPFSLRVKVKGYSTVLGSLSESFSVLLTERVDFFPVLCT